MLDQIDPAGPLDIAPPRHLTLPSDGTIQLPPRDSFAAALDSQIASCRRHRTVLAALCFGIDNLTAIEQEWGQAVAHRLLASAWARLAAGLREKDPSLHTGRGEFGVVIREARAPVAAVITDRIAALLAGPYRVEEGQVRLKVSAGFALLAHDDEADGAALAAAATRMRLSGLIPTRSSIGGASP